MVSSRCSSQTRGSGRTNTRKRRGRGASTVEVPIIIQPRNKMIGTSTVHTRPTCTAPPARPAPPHLGINRALANQTFSKFRVTDKITANRCIGSCLNARSSPSRTLETERTEMVFVFLVTQAGDLKSGVFWFVVYRKTARRHVASCEMDSGHWALRSLSFPGPLKASGLVRTL